MLMLLIIQGEEYLVEYSILIKRRKKLSHHQIFHRMSQQFLLAAPSVY